MQWLNPAGAWAFLAMIPVVILYLLKIKARREQVPSLFFWRLAQAATDANRPFQRLRNQLLLWIQLFLVALLALALMRPAGSGGLRGETVLVFDLSASMQTEEGEGTRLHQAKEAAYQILSEMGEEDGVTIITAGSALGQPLTRSSDHLEARRVIQGLAPENGAADLEGAVALAMAMKRDLPGLSVTVLSDCYEPSVTGISVHAVGQEMPNRSILSLRVSQGEDGDAAFAQIRNIGPETVARVECYADGVLCDLRTITLPENDTLALRFSLPTGAASVMARFAQPDALPVDDVRYGFSPIQTEQRALLITQGNVFLEKALRLRSDLVLTKADLPDGERAVGYDLYLYDGLLPETLPETGAVLAIRPDREVLGIAPQEEREATGALRAGTSAIAEELAQHLLLSEIAIKSYLPLKGGEPILTMGGDTLLAAVQVGNRRAAVLAFDLHDSNLPLQADFPVLIQNLLQYLLPNTASQIGDAVCGQTLPLPLNDRMQNASVRSPSGRTLLLEEGRLTDTAEIGLYTLREEREDGSVQETAFALHAPLEECDPSKVAASVGEEREELTSAGAGREWTVWILLLAFLTLLLEWEVSRRGA